MDSKEKTLNESSLKHHGWIPDNTDGQTWDDFILEALDIHAQNVAVELLIWYDSAGYKTTKEQAERIVNDFLQSYYLKERTEG
jgi:hypothetical protein